jgi:hypothetical protein
MGSFPLSMGNVYPLDGYIHVNAVDPVIFTGFFFQDIPSLFWILGHGHGRELDDSQR